LKLGALKLEGSLDCELPDFDCLEAVRYCDCTACRDTASNERSASVFSKADKRQTSSTYPKVVDMPKETEFLSQSRTFSLSSVVKVQDQNCVMLTKEKD
jgi:hypothetical protein